MEALAKLIAQKVENAGEVTQEELAKLIQDILERNLTDG